MNKDLFQNDKITGNSLIGFEFKGQFKDDENILIEKLKDILNRDISYSNIDYKLLEPTDNSAVLIKDGNSYEIKTSLYSYFEAIFILPKILELLKSLKTYNNSYLYFNIGFNKDFCDISQINITKFILEFNEDFILKTLCDATKDGNLEKLTDIKPQNLEMCGDTIRKQLESLKYTDDTDIYGITFDKLNLGYISFKYARGINYRNKWEEILKCVNHTIITIYNTCFDTNLNKDEIEKLDKLNKKYRDILDAFGCYELFKTRYKNIKITSDLNDDISVINVIFPSIKDKLFDIVIRNDIKDVEINYDSDISRLQLKGLELKKCYHLSGVDIVESELENCTIRNCDIYDTKIDASSIIDCNLFGYANCTESRLKNCFVSRNIQLKDCNVSGQLGKMGGIMKGGTLKDTSIISTMAEIDDNVEKNNVNIIQ